MNQAIGLFNQIIKNIFQIITKFLHQKYSIRESNQKNNIFCGKDLRNRDNSSRENKEFFHFVKSLFPIMKAKCLFQTSLIFRLKEKILSEFLQSCL